MHALFARLHVARQKFGLLIDLLDDAVENRLRKRIDANFGFLTQALRDRSRFPECRCECKSDRARAASPPACSARSNRPAAHRALRRSRPTAPQLRVREIALRRTKTKLSRDRRLRAGCRAQISHTSLPPAHSALAPKQSPPAGIRVQLVELVLRVRLRRIRHPPGRFRAIALLLRHQIFLRQRFIPVVIELRAHRVRLRAFQIRLRRRDVFATVTIFALVVFRLRFFHRRFRFRNFLRPIPARRFFRRRLRLIERRRNSLSSNVINTCPAFTVSPSRTRILSMRPPTFDPTRMSRASTVPEPCSDESRENHPCRIRDSRRKPPPAPPQ